MKDYQLYEIMLFFALYSILGWAADRCVFALRKRPGGRGLCKGPYMPAFGAAAVLTVCWSGPAAKEMAAWLGTDMDMTLPAAAFSALAAGAVCALTSSVLFRICSGKCLIHVSAGDVLLWMAGGVVTVAHLHPLLVAVTRWINPWIHMIFLIIFYLYMTSGCIDGAASLFGCRTKGKHYSKRK